MPSEVQNREKNSRQDTSMVSSSTEMWRSWVNGEIEGLFSLQEFHLTR